MRKFAVTLLIVLCSITTFSLSKSNAISANEISFVKDGFHVQIFYDNSGFVTNIEVTLGGPGTPGFVSWTPLVQQIVHGCFTGLIYVEDTGLGQVILDVNCNS